MSDDVDLPPVDYLTRGMYLARVEAARDALLTSDRPLVTLRWLTATTHPAVLAAAVRDERVRERMAEPMREVGEVLRRFAAALQPVLDGFAEAMRQFGQAAIDAGLSPEQPPDDPRRRALWLRQHRSTGPERCGPERQRPPRVHR